MVSGYHLIALSSVDSTNNYAAKPEMQPKLPHKSVIMAEVQTHGRGQLDHEWESQEGQNLILSIILRNLPFHAGMQIVLNHLISLSAVETIEYFSKQKATIKWPNDLLLSGVKLGGILVENSVVGTTIQRSIIGLGLNINQVHFKTGSFQSLKKSTGITFDRMRVLEYLLHLFDQNLSLISTEPTLLHSRFDSYLYGLNQIQTFRQINGNVFEGKITGTTIDGRLKIRFNDGVEMMFRHREFSFG
jgi:BirA family biotin operon repressor/biotin-[acetyl-CoA-carboxylase] ligase